MYVFVSLLLTAALLSVTTFKISCYLELTN